MHRTELPPDWPFGPTYARLKAERSRRSAPHPPGNQDGIKADGPMLSGPPSDSNAAGSPPHLACNRPSSEGNAAIEVPAKLESGSPAPPHKAGPPYQPPVELSAAPPSDPASGSTVKVGALSHPPEAPAPPAGSQRRHSHAQLHTAVARPVPSQLPLLDHSLFMCATRNTPESYMLSVILVLLRLEAVGCLDAAGAIDLAVLSRALKTHHIKASRLLADEPRDPTLIGARFFEFLAEEDWRRGRLRLDCRRRRSSAYEEDGYAGTLRLRRDWTTVGHTFRVLWEYLRSLVRGRRVAYTTIVLDHLELENQMSRPEAAELLKRAADAGVCHGVITSSGAKVIRLRPAWESDDDP